MNRVKIGFFSLTGTSDTGDDSSYLEWHAMDHMPEQYQLPGLVNGQRWRSTPACRAARAAQSDELAPVENVVCYLMGDPVERTLDDFLVLGRRLAEMGRYPEVIPSRLLGAFHLLEAHASPRVLVSDEVVPWRPNRGIYAIVERTTDEDALDGYLQRLHRADTPALLAVPGVAGVWCFASSPLYRRETFTKGRFRVTVCYLDEDPATVGESLRPLLESRWRDAPVEPLLAAPFESVVQWNWRRFLQGSEEPAWS